MTKLIEAHALRLDRGGRTVLSDIDFAIAAGEIVTLVGPNGSGKSSLVRALIGALEPAGGTVRRAAGLRIGYVPQSMAAGSAMPLTVRRFLSLPEPRTDAEAEAALAAAGAEGLGPASLGALSGGQLQRVLLARALAGAPDLLILDEPTASLDQPGAAALYQTIERVRRDAGCAVLMVSHDLHVVMAASDRVICLNGHICCEGAPHVVADAPAYRALFGSGTGGALALYQHDHDHSHDHDHDHGHGHGRDGERCEAVAGPRGA
ncbi:zinc transport system ATP-binding protein [Hasllibacter halocynthiae]|uniref:Zinc transport system ATP-binding protein n=1 Tax=Hasllibacter halocynthiae TaxID=595589 RepID=A0A2T0X7C5_9RHOB|nr:metal ABC transporter ATP-binding protein [Hasllibacter halocynthiae]PRY94836.1 zinc transport system ATP-binding protein [Hasllibacter halocynthiae]